MGEIVELTLRGWSLTLSLKCGLQPAVRPVWGEMQNGGVKDRHGGQVPHLRRSMPSRTHPGLATGAIVCRLFEASILRGSVLKWFGSAMPRCAFRGFRLCIRALPDDGT